MGLNVLPATHLKCNFKCELNYRNLLFLVFLVPNQCNYQCVLGILHWDATQIVLAMRAVVPVHCEQLPQTSDAKHESRLFLFFNSFTMIATV